MLRFNSRGLFLVLGVVILLIVSVGCNHTNDNIPDDTKDTQSSEVQPVTPVTTEDDGVISFSAGPYINPGISWEYSLDINIKNGNIYINDILYKESSSVPPVIEYGEGFLSDAAITDKINQNQEMTNTLEKIKNSETCHLLETQQYSPVVGEKLCVYEIDDVFYFVQFYDNGKVMRIHYAPIAQIEGCTNGALIFPTHVIE